MKVYKNIYTIFLIVLTLISSTLILYFEGVYAQSMTLKDGKEKLQDFIRGMESVRLDLQENFNQLSNEIKNRIDFDSVSSHLSLGSQYFIQGKIDEGVNELDKANDAWKNSSNEIIGIGNEFIELSGMNSTSMNIDTREILGNFGNTIKDIGIKLENLRIKLNS